MRQQLLCVLLLCGLVAALSAATPVLEGATMTAMPVGIDYSGAFTPEDAACLKQMGVSFIGCHYFDHATTELAARIDGFAASHQLSFLFNQEQCVDSYVPADKSVFRKPGSFFTPARQFIEACTSSPRFLGVCYDEAEHWSTNGTMVTAGGKEFVPCFYDAEGDSLDQAYDGFLHNLKTLMRVCYPGFSARPGSGPCVGVESVFPIMQHIFARAGFIAIPKLLKETMLPVHAAMALGAAKQYHTQYWTCCDLWFGGQYPGHSPQQLRSALVFSYWTGAAAAYVEGFANMAHSVASFRDGKVALDPYGEAIRWFSRDYLTSHTRSFRAEHFTPEVIIVRFPDTDWGQVDAPGWIRGGLFGARNLVPDDQTRYWRRIWNVITHGVIPVRNLNWNQNPDLPYRLFIPANNVAVYDHTASDPALYSAAKLVFLTGKKISPECAATLERLVPEGLVVVAPSHLSPGRAAGATSQTMVEHPAGRGSWIVSDDVCSTPVRQRIAPFLGSPNELRYVFGETEVVFTAPKSHDELEVRLRRLPSN